MKKKIIAAIILLIAIAVAGSFGYIKFKSSINDKKPEKKWGFPLEIMKTTNQPVKIEDDCTITLTHYLYDEEMQVIDAVFQVTSDSGKVKAEFDHEGSLDSGIGNAVYLSSVGFYIGNMSVKGVRDMSVHFKDGTEHVFVKDKKIKADVDICEQTYMDRWSMALDFGHTYDMDNMDYVVINGVRYDAGNKN